MRKLKALSLILAAAISTSPVPVKAQAVNPVAYDVSYLIDVDEGAERFCALDIQQVTVNDKIQAAASLTVTAVSGSPFLNVSVGDQLLVNDSDGTPYRLSVATRSSATSITVFGLNNSTGAALSSLTLTNASFLYRKVRCGTAINDGIIDVSRIRGKVLNSYISQSSLSSGNLQIRVMCRTGAGSPWVQVAPSITPPSVTPTYYGYATGVLGLFGTGITDGFNQCRVGFSLSGTDTGAADLVSVQLSGIS